ncbi:MAG: hypothetical protein A3E84_01625 [Gammaproteobacteria bacterium RIFCSPHIGHO2_12_FULL_42_13]|nr:MAG: hypothetical protein A3E84_01625 [Gammaproteobacteria bacterium RIFCSPHIGHO2_12_FULL_42_13]
MTILTCSTEVQLWQDAVRHGEDMCAVSLQEELEAYLVFLLMRYMNHPEVAKQVLAAKFLDSMQAHGSQRQSLLQSLGDESLLFAGLFPHLAERRQVKLRYFVEIGQAAYANISLKTNDLFSSLARQFVMLMDVLQSIHQHSKNATNILPLEAYERWNTIGSQRALHILQQYSSATPVSTPTPQEEDGCLIKLSPKDQLQ